jgi:tetratricopeptide (TPR) repeat protein
MWSKDIRTMLGQILLEQGKPEAALAELRTAVEGTDSDNSRTRSRLTVLGQIYARMGDAASLEDLTRRFRELARPGASPRIVRDLDLFTGLVELERGRYRESAAAFDKAAAAIPPTFPAVAYEPLVYYYLGLAREKAGDAAGAAAAFEEISKEKEYRFLFGDVFPLAVFGQAKAEEALGRRAAALEGYRYFLELWKNADPGRPEIEAARTRLNALTGSSGSHR